MISITHCVKESRKLIEDPYRTGSDPRQFLQQSRDAIAECRRSIATANRQLEETRIWRGAVRTPRVS